MVDPGSVVEPAAPMPAPMVHVVGPVCVSGPDGALQGAELGGRRALLVLTALALAEAPMTAAHLADLVWRGEPPPTWSAALRGVVRGLRADLAGIGLGEQRLVATVPGGYRLAAGTHVDVLVAAEAVRTAATLARAERRATALALAEPWARLRGEDLLAGEDADWLRPHRAHVDEIGRHALDLVAEVASHDGDHDRAAAGARALVAADPLDERAHRRLMGVLDAAGDRAGVVAAYEVCRTLLADELGVDPSVETRQAYLAALEDHLSHLVAPVPRAASTFRGRTRELSELVAELVSPGLVTVGGPGGVGKSRLVAEAAPSGTLWVSLEPVAEDQLVAATVALTIGVPPGDDPVGSVVTELAPRGLCVLVLDGCEAVVDGAGSLAQELLARCPRLVVVATSRRPLGVLGERLLTVLAWEVPDEVEVSDIAGHPIAELMVDRVRENGGLLDAAQVSGALLRGLMRRCAGLPLAVELVATQLAQAAPGDVADQLDLIGSGGDPLRSIAAATYAASSEEEAAVFRRFAVLDGAVDLGLARSVLAGDDVPPIRVARILRQLAANGLLTVDRASDRWRWTQDDELHRYARELLRAEGTEQATYALLADAVRAALPDDPRAVPTSYAGWVGDHLASVRSLLGAAVDGRADPDRCLELAFRMHRYWAASNVGEGCFWLRRLLEAAAPGPWTAYATYALGYLEYWSGDAERAAPRLRLAADLLIGVDDPYAARALVFLGGLLDDTDHGVEAVATVRQAIAIAEQHGADLKMPAVMGLGSVLSERGDPEAAEWAQRAIDLVRSQGSEDQLTVALPTAAMICWQVGALDLAQALVDEGHRLHGSERRISRVVLLSAAAGLALARGDAAQARDLAGVADREGAELGVERELPLVRALLARSLLATGEVGAAVAAAVAGLEAALSLTFDFPLAIGLETAVLVLAAAGEGTVEDRDALVSAATEVRRRGDRAAPATLSAAWSRSGSSSGRVATVETTPASVSTVSPRNGRARPLDHPVDDPRLAARAALKLLAGVALPAHYGPPVE